MNDRDDIERQLSALAEQLVAQSRPSPAPSGRRVDVGARPRRGLIVGGAIAASAALLAVFAFVATRDDGTTKVSTIGTSGPAGPPEYGGNVTVLESAEHGPQLCGAVADSYPPQCGGPDIVGWSWDAVDTEESVNGTTWGEFYVVGTWADGRLTLTRPATPPVPVPRVPSPDYTTPCTELRDGQQASEAGSGDVPSLEGNPEYAGSWWDEANGVMNYAFTANIDQHRADIESQSTGPVCVVEMSTSEAELLAAQETLTSVSSRPVGVEMYGVGTMLDRDDSGAPRFVLAVEVIVADPATEAWVESFIGDVPYRLGALLRPVEPLPSTTSTVSASTTAEVAMTTAVPAEITNAADALGAWNAAGIDDYSFHIRFQCECALSETSIVVDQGVPSATSTLPGGDDTFATIPALIAEIERAEREATGLLRVTWGPYGVPAAAWVENLSDEEIGWTITGFRSREPEVAAVRTVDEARAAWEAAGIDDYSFTYVAGQFMSSRPGPTTITVHNGLVASASGEIAAEHAPTIPDLIERIARDQPTGYVDVVIWDDAGIPTAVLIMPSTERALDDLEWTITEFTVL